MAYIAPSYGAYIFKNTAQTIATGTTTTITSFTSQIYNVSSAFTVNLSTGTINVLTDGYYFIMGFLEYNDTSSSTPGSDRSVLLNQNSGTLLQEASCPAVYVANNNTRIVNSGIWPLAAGDAVNIKAFHQDAGSVDISIARLQVWKMA